MEQLAFAYLVQDYPYDRAVLEEMLELLGVCSVSIFQLS